MRVVAAVLLALALGGCETRCEQDLDCADEDDFGFGVLWRCGDAGVCEQIPCETRRDCALEQHCLTFRAEDDSLEPQGSCVEGCTSKLDCPARHRCVDGACEPKPCRDGHTDCNLGEDCVEGRCVDAPFPICQSCNPSQNVYDAGLEEDDCDTLALGHPFCGDGNFCWNLPNGPSCGTPCELNTDCPGGFGCGKALISASGCPGDFTVVGQFCISDFCFDDF